MGLEFEWTMKKMKLKSESKALPFAKFSRKWSNVGAIYVIILVLCFGCLCDMVSGQEENASGSCVCGGVPCEKNFTSSDCPNGRVIARRDCTCCFVCAKQLTEECNDKDKPCDTDYGLACGTDQRCTAKIQCGDDTSCSSDLMCVGGACADPCKVSPDVCRDQQLKNGICIARNHRALCSCPIGQSVNSDKECVPTLQQEGANCQKEGRKFEVGQRIYVDRCKKVCDCQGEGEINCRDITNEEPVVCQKGFIPMSKVSGEMGDACKILIGNESAFDGCCVPEKCQNVTSQDDAKGGRDFKLTESQNYLGSLDDKPKQRDPLIMTGEEHNNKPSPSSPSSDSLKKEDKETTRNGNDGGVDGGNNNNRDEVNPSSVPSTSTSSPVSTTTEASTTIATTTNEQQQHVASEGEGGVAVGVVGGSLMQVTVRQRTTHSAVVDLPKNDKEAILSIALSKQLIENPGSHDVWKEHKIPPGLPQITLSDLLPNTSYTLKYTVDTQDYPSVQFITDEMEDTNTKEAVVAAEPSEKIPNVENKEQFISTEDSKETHPVTNSEESMEYVSGSGSSEMTKSQESPTSAMGCLYNGTSYDVGHIILDGCDQRCECMKNGEVKCSERCSIPLFRRGAFGHDKMCFEEPSGVDECCVIIACARGSNIAGEARELTVNPCDSVKCGLNAFCLGPSVMLNPDNENQENQTLCVCKEGFLGDPYDETEGCKQGVTPTAPSAASSSSTNPSSSTTATQSKLDGCVFNNKTYDFGADHYDGCSYKCHCETSGEFLCRPRCNFRRDEEKEIPMGCEVKKDPSDLECCEMLVCHGEPLESGTRKDKSTIPPDGCVYKNKTFARDEKFYDGCEQQCMCFSNGDVTCQPRCPPAGPNVNDDCVTLKDPSDSCCTVTLCGNSTLSDVMKKANETGALLHLPEISTTVESIRATTAGTGRSMQARHDDIVEVQTINENVTSTAAEPVKTMEIITPETNSKPIISLTPPDIKITMIVPVNETAVKISVKVPENEAAKADDSQFLNIKHSRDLSTWTDYLVKVKDLFVEGSDELHPIVGNLLPGKEYYFRVSLNGSESNTASAFTKSDTRIASSEEQLSTEGEGSHEGMSGEDGGASENSVEQIPCHYKNKVYEYGVEFYEECDAYCACDVGGKVQCVPIECPTDGLDLLDANCLRWEPISEEFHKEPPNCCPELRCMQNSSCSLAGGFVFQNFEEIPQKITGCDKRCYCEYGNITCSNLCPPMSEKPPADLPCPPELATPITMPHNECCLTWVCQGHNRTGDGSHSLLDQMLTHNVTQQTLHDYMNNMTNVPFNDSLPHHHNLPPFDHSHEHDHDQDQFIPPSTGNQPAVVGLDKINPQQLQELLHQLSTLGEANTGNMHPFIKGTYVQVRDPHEVVELQKSGAKIIEQAEDGSYIVFIPSAPLPNYTDGHGHVHGHIHGHGRPHEHGAPYPNHPTTHGFPGGDHYQYGHNPPPYIGANEADKVSNILIRPLNESTLQIDFTVSPILVGLNGHVEVMYTSDFAHKPNPDQWESKVFQQAEDLIDNSHLQLFLTALEPDTDYHIQIKIVMADLHNTPTSEIILVRTPPPSIPTTTLPPEILTDPELKVSETSSKFVRLNWRKFTDLENSLIDGVQITYKRYDDKVYSTTPLIHRSINDYQLGNLQSDMEYEVNLLFIPFDSNQTTTLKSEKPIHVKTAKEEDEYDFKVLLRAGKVTESSVELVVEGVPHPEDKFVNIYQVIYQSGTEKEQKSTFKVPNRETTKKATITGLRPGTSYTVWLEAFLTNGKKKRSTVLTVSTKAGELPSPEKSEQEKLQEAASLPQATSYYGALVALAIIAALSIVGIIVLLMILIKKQNHAKAPINDRKSESSYDNPSFKNYDMESNGHSKPGEP